MSDLRAAARAALEQWDIGDDAPLWQMEEAIDALRAALAAPPPEAGTNRSAQAIRNAFRAEVNGALAEMDDPEFAAAVREVLGEDEPEPLLLPARAMAPPPEAIATLHTCGDDHEGPDGTHADGSPCRDKPMPLYAAPPANPVHVYAGENLARCGAEVGDPCPACAAGVAE